MSHKENENKAIKIMERIKYQIYHQIHHQLLNVKLNEILPQKNIQEGLRFVNFINKIYILGQQEKKILHEKNQSIHQVQQAHKQLRQAEK